MIPFRTILCPFLLLLMIPSSNVLAQTWRSELYPAKGKLATNGLFYSDKIIQDFSYAGYHRGEKSIPSRFRLVVDVTKPPYHADNTGDRDATLPVQQAIDAMAAKGGGVVYLPAGIYKLGIVPGKDYCLAITHSNIVIRGDGPGRTFLFNQSTSIRGKAILKVGTDSSWSVKREKQQRLTKDLMKPTTIIPVESTKGFTVGSLVIVRNYIDNDWIEKHHMLPYWKDKGASLKGLQYCRQVTAIDTMGQTLTVDIPIRYALEKAHGSVVYTAPSMLSEIGVEGFSVGNKQLFTTGDWSEESYTNEANPSYQCHDSWAIAMSHVTNGWIRDVASYQPAGNTAGAHLLSNGIKVTETKNISIVNCRFQKPQFGGGGGNGYMYRIMGNETLVQNCTSDSCRHGFVLSGMAASGNVFLRCTDKNSGKQTGITGSEKTSGSGSDHHMHFSHSNLFDQCVVENSYFAAGWRKWGGSPIHGLTGAHSVYWNIKSNGTQEFAVQTQQGRYGYVIGTSGDKPLVRTTEWDGGTAIITDPVDHVEGLSKGGSLEPQSLYLDQLKRRLRLAKTYKRSNKQN